MGKNRIQESGLDIQEVKERVSGVRMKSICFLPTAFCLLPTAYCRLPARRFGWLDVVPPDHSPPLF